MRAAHLGKQSQSKPRRARVGPLTHEPREKQILVVGGNGSRFEGVQCEGCGGVVVAMRGVHSASCRHMHVGRKGGGWVVLAAGWPHGRVRNFGGARGGGGLSLGGGSVCIYHRPACVFLYLYGTILRVKRNRAIPLQQGLEASRVHFAHANEKFGNRKTGVNRRPATRQREFCCGAASRNCRPPEGHSPVHQPPLHSPTQAPTPFFPPACRSSVRSN